MPAFNDLKLYVLPGCPFCSKVDRFLDANNVHIEHLSVTDPKNADDLVRIGGKRQSPCLIIDGKALYESDDIIAYLQSRL